MSDSKTGSCLVHCTVGIVAFIVLCGCKESLQQRVEAAKGNAWKEQQAVAQQELEAQSDYLDEWPDFKVAAQKQVLLNSNSIDHLRSQLAAETDRAKAAPDSFTLEALSQTNRSLLTKLDQYKDEGKVGWDVFKRDYSVEAADLQLALKNLAVKHG